MKAVGQAPNAVANAALSNVPHGQILPLWFGKIRSVCLTGLQPEQLQRIELY